MTCTEEYKEHIEYTFHAFCKVVIRNAKYNALRTWRRKYQREISLEYLDRILKSYWTGLDVRSVNDYSTEDINYDFKRNIPNDVMTWLKDMLQAGGKLPQKEIFIKAGYTEQKADELVQEAENENYEMLDETTV